MADISPDLFIDHVFAYQRTAAVKAAVELDVFSAIGPDGETADLIALHTGAAVHGIRILCDFLTIGGLLIKTGDRYTRTPSTAVFLDRDSPACMASIVDFLAAPEMMALYLDNPTAFVRNGGSPGLANLTPENPVWVKFARAMAPFMAPVADGVAAALAQDSPLPRKVLDIAAGHGLFGIAVARVAPEAEVVALDWKSVLHVAVENARRAGIDKRYSVLPGSAFDVDWGHGYDVVLLPNFLHHFDRPTCEALLRRARESLAPGGRVAVVEMVPNEDRVTPPFAAAFAFVMLGSTPHGDAYLLRDLESMGRAAGLTLTLAQPLPPSPQTLLLFNAAAAG
jgi:2-polyprenyl-3-methyl-5-hydroxy-6-metoxy-1,4-benzoquinol methylase